MTSTNGIIWLGYVRFSRRWV